MFTPIDKKKVRAKIGLPDVVFCVGSFQRDTDKRGGPKTIKGPDIFVDTMKLLKSKIPNLLVVLSGRRRKYVINHLQSIKIPYKYVYLDDYDQMPSLYNVLDCYLVSSRVEGGPKALMESVACNVPIVSTDCGMARDVIQEEVNGFVRKTSDLQGLSECILKVYNRDVEFGDIRDTVKPFDYKTSVVAQYETLFGLMR